MAGGTVRELRTALVGARYHKGAYGVLRRMVRGDALRPVREPDNPHDARAVALYVGAQHMGYVPRELAPLISRALEAGEPVTVTLDCIDAHLHGAPTILVRLGGKTEDGEWDFLG